MEHQITTRKLVKVFLASPGDLAPERQTAKQIVDELNALLADVLGYQVELVGWEDTVSVFGRPQATINRELERCDLFVGLMWKKWGTPPDTTGCHTSGFEEEFETTVARRSKHGRPEISLLLKDIDEEFRRDPGDQLQRVLAFRQRLIDEKLILFENFSSTTFEKKFRRCIVSYVTTLRSQEEQQGGDRGQAPTMIAENPGSSQANDAASSPLSFEGASFLREFVTRTEREEHRHSMTASEVARFRLLGTLVGAQGNDEPALGIHDANLLYFERERLQLGQREIRGLLSNGLTHYTNETAPIWHWLSAAESTGDSKSLLPLYSLIGSVRERAGALRAMALIGEPIPVDVSRQTYLNTWFANDSPTDVKIAALAYLSESGVMPDIVQVHGEFEKADNQTWQAAAETILRIALRHSRQKAITALYELQPGTARMEILTEILGEGVSNDTLTEGLKHVCGGVRRICAERLRASKSLPVELAEQLKNDSDTGVRYEAISELADRGLHFSEEEAKAILSAEPPKWAPWSPWGADDVSSDVYLERFMYERLRQKPDSEIELMAAEESPLDRDAKFIFEERHFVRFGDAVRRAVDDEYQEEFSRILAGFQEQFPGNEIVNKLRNLEGHLRKKFTRQGLDILCRKRNAADLGRIRRAVAGSFAEHSDCDIEYLKKCGEWEDVATVIEDLKRSPSHPSTERARARHRLAARAIYALAKDRVEEVMTMDAPARLLAYLVVEMSDRAFSGLGDSTVKRLLHSEDDTLRKATALRCVRSFAKRRLDRTLAEYLMSDKMRYYNVVHWLDLGVSTPRDQGRAAARRLLDRWS